MGVLAGVLAGEPTGLNGGSVEAGEGWWTGVAALGVPHVDLSNRADRGYQYSGL